MNRRLASLLAAVAACAGFLPASAAAANGGVALGNAAALGRSAAIAPSARQASLPGECPADVRLDAPQSTQESAMLCLVNAARARYGLPPLSPSAPLRESTVGKGRDLTQCNEFSHTACSREFSFWIRQSGYMSAPCWRVGENLAWGVDTQGTVGSVFRAWMRSPSHRENILGAFEETGIELRVGTLGGLTGVHLWVEHFGSHCGA